MMALATRVACNEEGNGDACKSDGNEGDGQARATKAMATTKANNNQPAMGLTKAGSGWQESVDEVTTRPQWWAMMSDESVRRMMMAVTKRARVERAMVMAIEAVGNKESKGDKEEDGIGNEGGV
jgi:hypothetical protein